MDLTQQLMFQTMIQKVKDSTYIDSDLKNYIITNIRVAYNLGITTSLNIINEVINNETDIRIAQPIFTKKIMEAKLLSYSLTDD